MKQLLIIGASGHGKVVADIARLNGYDRIIFFDDNDQIKSCGRYCFAGKTSNAHMHEGDIVIAIGNAKIRKKLSEEFFGRNIPVLIHPSAVVADDVIISEGSVVMAGAVINANAVIGKGCIINTCASVDHDCIIGDYVHVSVGAHIAGTVNIENMTWIGLSAAVSNNISICGECMIGAGAVVINDIIKSGTYIGVPAKLK